MPVALILLIGLYIWLVWQRTHGGEGKKALVGEEAMRAEKALRFVRVGMMLTAIVLMAAIIWMNSQRGAAGTATGGGAEVSGIGAVVRDASRFVGLGGGGAVLPFFIIVGTAFCYGYTIVALAKVVGYHRERRHGAAPQAS